MPNEIGDYDESDATVEEFDAMWASATPVDKSFWLEMISMAAPKGTTGTPVKAAITSSTIAAHISGTETASTANAATITVAPLDHVLSSRQIPSQGE